MMLVDDALDVRFGMFDATQQGRALDQTLRRQHQPRAPLDGVPGVTKLREATC
jgi:hypothetical protein